MKSHDARAELIAILRAAHSGELAAALAYRGHWRSARLASDRARIREIEEDELRHRAGVRAMLDRLGARPNAWAERRACVIGRALGALCHLAGTFAPHYGAGMLERRNVGEYEAAARCAEACGEHALVNPLLEMAEVEWEHEAFFRERVLSHPLSRWVPTWPALPPKSAIRRPYERASAMRGARASA